MSAVDGGVIAVVLTFDRPKLATEVVSGLIEREGFRPEEVLLVINGTGGLESAELEESIQTVRLTQNLGPAGGFRVGLDRVAATPASWVYLCEDDVGLFDLPTPRVKALIEKVEHDPRPIGAIAAYGRKVNRRTGRSVPFVPDGSAKLPEIDVAAWGATLVSRAVVDSGVRPDERMFFGFEDFDFFYRVRKAGFLVVLDEQTAAKAGERVFVDNRNNAFNAYRPTDDLEPWRKYYEARNFLTLARRHGTWTWRLSHLFFTLRRIQIAPSWAHRRAAFHGLLDGIRRREGPNNRYVRAASER